MSRNRNRSKSNYNTNPELHNPNSMQQAYELIQKDKEERVRACAEELHALLERYGCMLDVQLEKSGAGFLPSIGLVAK